MAHLGDSGHAHERSQTPEFTLADLDSPPTHRASAPPTPHENPPAHLRAHPHDVYEDKASDSVAFLTSLLDDAGATIAGLDVLDLLTVFREREGNLPFAYRQPPRGATVQGLRLSRTLAAKFYRERLRLGPGAWASGVAHARASAATDVSLHMAPASDFFTFRNFYPRLKNHLAHYSLRTLVVCGDRIENGIFYPTVQSTGHHSAPGLVDDLPDPEASGKIIRLSPDGAAVAGMKLDCVCDLRSVPGALFCKVSAMACAGNHLVSGTTGGVVVVHDVHGPAPRMLQRVRVAGAAARVNHISLSGDLVRLAAATQLVALDARKPSLCATDAGFRISHFSPNPCNHHELVAAGDSTSCFVMDTRRPSPAVMRLQGNRDHVGSCSWSPEGTLLLSGGQDGTVRLWDRRNPARNLACWNGAAGSAAHAIDPDVLGGPVRNCRFSPSGKYIVWAESLDHVGIVPTADIDSAAPRTQSIDYIGKCVGLDMCWGTGRDEHLVIGVNDCPLGGIFTYTLDAADKPVPFDFSF